MDTKDVLIKVRELLSDRDHWTKGSFARVKKGGKEVAITDTRATCWCLRGAINKIESEDSEYSRAQSVIMGCLPGNAGVELGIIGFNDRPSTKHSQILKVLDCAIEKVSNESDKS